MPISSGSAPNCPALGFQSLSKTKPKRPGRGERGARFAEEAYEEVDDQDEDQRGERGEPVLQGAVGKARKR